MIAPCNLWWPQALTVEAMHGAESEMIPPGQSVAEARRSLKHILNVPVQAVAQVNGRRVPEWYFLEQVDTLEFVVLSGSKGATWTEGGVSHSDSSIEIICGDCLQVMPYYIADKSVSVVVTSVPYNLGVKYNAYEDSLRFDQYLDWLDRGFAEIKRGLRDDGSFFLNVGSSRKKSWNAMRVAEVAGRYFKLQNEIVWVKSLTVKGRSHGHFRPLPGPRHLNHCFESVFHFTKTGNVKLDRLAIGVPYQDKSNLRRNCALDDVRCAGDVWFIPYQTVQSNGDRGHHPATFPVELPMRCIKLSGVREGMVVLDPFVGIGTTLLACQKLGVHGIGIELSEAYCAEAKRRLAEGGC